MALELVRVTEAAALASARWVGMGDKEAADQAAVDGMHAVLHTIPMDGVVVIGEGEKDEAPMLHNGEQVGDGSPPEGRHRGRPAGGHAADRARRAERARGDRARRARRDVRPRPVRLHGEDGLRRGDRRPDGPRPAAAETVRLIAERKGTDVRDVMAVVLDRPRHEDGIREIRATPARACG